MGNYYKYLNGQYIEMTESEVDEIKAENQRKLLEELQHDVVKNADLIELMLGYYDITKPDGTKVPVYEIVNQVIDLPVKLGQKWEMVFNGNGFVYQMVSDPDAIGTSEDNYIVFTSDVPLIENAFYKKDGKIQVFMGNDTWVDW